jgi:hypothetical protein
MQTATFNEVLTYIEKLPLEQQETLLEIVHKRIIEARRNEIAKNAQETIKAFKSGKARRGSPKDFRKAMTK